MKPAIAYRLSIKDWRRSAQFEKTAYFLFMTNQEVETKMKDYERRDQEKEVELLTTKDIAKRIGCSPRVAREIIVREIPHIRIGRDPVQGKIRVQASDFEAWIQGRKTVPNREK